MTCAAASHAPKLDGSNTATCTLCPLSTPTASTYGESKLCPLFTMSWRPHVGLMSVSSPVAAPDRAMCDVGAGTCVAGTGVAVAGGAGVSDGDGDSLIAGDEVVAGPGGRVAFGGVCAAKATTARAVTATMATVPVMTGASHNRRRLKRLMTRSSRFKGAGCRKHWERNVRMRSSFRSVPSVIAHFLS
jgi:hypothetical protein